MSTSLSSTQQRVVIDQPVGSGELVFQNAYRQLPRIVALALPHRNTLATVV